MKYIRLLARVNTIVKNLLIGFDYLAFVGFRWVSSKDEKGVDFVSCMTRVIK